MRKFIFASIFCLSTLANAQKPIYDFVHFSETIAVPQTLNSERAAVIFSVPDQILDGFNQVGDYENVLLKTHKAFVTMGVDPILYLQDINYIASSSAQKSYVELFNQRKITNVIFFSQKDNEYEILIGPYSGSSKLILEGSEVFAMRSNSLHELLLDVGREIRRADYEIQNFLIPEKPSYIGGLSIVEKTLLKNYPGVLRRSKLAVERFALLDTSKTQNEEILARIIDYNRNIASKNLELEEILKSSYPYEFEMIDPMSDDELKRKRYQFVLRSVCSTVETAKKMLDYDVVPGTTGFASIIPVMPDQTRVKTIPRNAIVCKFYVRQNISKNVHVGVWDADVTWQEALHNMIGNLAQDLRVK